MNPALLLSRSALLSLLCLPACTFLGMGTVPMPSRDDSLSFYGPGSERILKGGLPTLLFGEESWDLPAAEAEKLTKAKTRLSEPDQPKLLLAGFANDNGTDEFNRVLGEARAQAVRRELISLGVPADRLQTVSYGNEFGAKEGPAGRRVELGLITE